MAYRRSGLGKKAVKLSEGLLSTAVDLTLVSIFYGLRFTSSGYADRAEREAHEDLYDLNYQTLKRAVVHLKRKGLIQAIKGRVILPEITTEGKKRLNSLIPQYDEKRIWDGRIYLVTYDLPVKRNAERNLLREFLKKIGCGMLQQSVWLTPYNPTELIREFSEERDLEDLILVSSLGKDGTIGEMELAELMEKVYHLEKLNYRYQELLIEAEDKRVDKERLVFLFLSILKDDPQLPFELLPEDWVGERAYRFFQKITQKTKKRRNKRVNI